MLTVCFDLLVLKVKTHLSENLVVDKEYEEDQEENPKS